MSVELERRAEPTQRTPPDGGDLEVTVLMPCLDEAETVGTCVEKAHRTLRRLGVRGEVLVADNGSSDGSQEKRGPAAPVSWTWSAAATAAR